MKFYLGTDRAPWLADPTIDVPLFVSHNTLKDRRGLPESTHGWALDSGGFTELNKRGPDAFPDGPEPYVDAVYRYRDRIGRLEWAAPQDWMVEPWMVERTGLTVEEHQRRTVQNYLDLTALAPDLPFIPVLQGWTAEDYLRCVDLYAQAGVDLYAQPTVGLGSVCRRQSAPEVARMAGLLAGLGLSLHGFGVKTSGIAALLDLLVSADSFAWSFTARREQIRLPGCQHGGWCAHCPRFALQWRQKVLARAAAPYQLALL